MGLKYKNNNGETKNLVGIKSTVSIPTAAKYLLGIYNSLGKTLRYRKNGTTYWLPTKSWSSYDKRTENGFKICAGGNDTLVPISAADKATTTNTRSQQGIFFAFIVGTQVTKEKVNIPYADPEYRVTVHYEIGIWYNSSASTKTDLAVTLNWTDCFGGTHTNTIAAGTAMTSSIKPTKSNQIVSIAKVANGVDVVSASTSGYPTYLTAKTKLTSLKVGTMSSAVSTTSDDRSTGDMAEVYCKTVHMFSVKEYIGSANCDT